MENQTPKVGSPVIFHDSKNQPHNALISCVWSDTMINLVFVSADESKQDNYGRQIERQTSVCNVNLSTAPGNYWRFDTQQAKEAAQPASV